MKIATISSKYQITIPKTILMLRHIQQGSKVLLYPEKGALMVKPLKTSIAEQTAGSLQEYVKPKKLGLSLAKVRQETQTIAAEELAKKYD